MCFKFALTFFCFLIGCFPSACVADSPADLTADASPASGTPFPQFSWDRVPLNLHFGKRRGDLTDQEIEFIADQSSFICLEKSHGRDAHGSTEAGIADTARRIVQRNPKAKVLFYFNAFINWPGYQAFESYEDRWTLRDSNGEIVTHPSGTPRPDPSIPAFREWWSDVVVKANETAPLSGVFIDAIPQALSPQLARAVGSNKAAEIVDGLKKMIRLTKRKLGPDRIVLVNGLRDVSYREVLDWEGIDGVMIEHFGEFRSTSPESMKTDLESISLAASKGKFVVLKGWPGFHWLDREMMRKPSDQLLRLARERIDFPLACFLVAAQPGCHFCYSWGYTSDHGMLESYPEFNRKLGRPLGNATWEGLTAKRKFEHADVSVDLNTRRANISWE